MEYESDEDPLSQTLPEEIAAAEKQPKKRTPEDAFLHAHDGCSGAKRAALEGKEDKSQITKDFSIKNSSRDESTSNDNLQIDLEDDDFSLPSPLPQFQDVPQETEAEIEYSSYHKASPETSRREQRLVGQHKDVGNCECCKCFTRKAIEGMLANSNSSKKFMEQGKSTKTSVHWFRHGLRIHDNPSLLQSICDCDKFYAIFIFDGETAGTKLAGYNRMKFLTESLNDLDIQLRKQGSQLHVFKGEPVEIFRTLHKECGMTRLTFEQDCEAIWNRRDDAVRRLCKELGIDVVECISHTLWDPYKIIEANGGQPPLTYEMFLQVSGAVGLPPRPVPDPEWDSVLFGEITDSLAAKLKLCPSVPSPEDLGFSRECDEACAYVGGEKAALVHLEERLRIEEDAFRDGYILPNQVNPDILGPPMSMSAALRFGCLSVRKFFWEVQEVYFKLHKGMPPPSHSLTAQLIWREFFYCMSANNPMYDKMVDNPICIDIPWYKDEKRLLAWKDGRTGYPFIDACMRQLRKEGWIHHVCRTAVACFLTRGDLWISWEEGLQVFLKYLIDADWSVSAGNWMWVSSSAFERQLDCSTCICPVNYGRRIEPTGDYIRRYVPEIADLPQDYIFEPWLAPLAIQKRFNCVIGQHYPERVVIHEQVSKENQKMMEDIRLKMTVAPPHCCPSNVKETTLFLRLPQSCYHNVL